MVVVDMVEARPRDVDQRLGDLVEIIDDLHIIMPRLDIILLQLEQRRKHLVLALVSRLIKGFRFAHHLLEQFAVFVEQADQRLIVNRRHLAHRVRYLADAAVDDRSLVRERLHFGLLGSVLLQLAVMEHGALEQQVGAQHSQHDQRDRTAPNQSRRYDERDRKGDQSREKPTRDHRQHACNPIYGAFAAPSPVGQRAAHRDHECHIGRRERQLQRSSRRDQNRGHRQIDRRPDQVEWSLVLAVEHRHESAGDETLNAVGRVFLVVPIDIQRAANDRA